MKMYNIFFLGTDVKEFKQVMEFLPNDNVLFTRHSEGILDFYVESFADIDFIILDENSEFLYQIREFNPNIRIFMMTKETNIINLMDILNTGIDYVITKPLDKNEFLKGISKIKFRIKKTKENKIRNKVLSAYKRVVDYGTIVSMTDKKGIITYVNQPFCDISGYTKEELIGKPHNIIRHPDMPKSTFKKMWNIIQKGGVFEGLVKNRKKDGGAYYVQTIITSIRNTFGEIEGYIATRFDVTDLVMKCKIDIEKDMMCEYIEPVKPKNEEEDVHLRFTTADNKISAEEFISELSAMDFDYIQDFIESFEEFDAVLYLKNVEQITAEHMYKLLNTIKEFYIQFTSLINNFYYFNTLIEAFRRLISFLDDIPLNALEDVEIRKFLIDSNILLATDLKNWMRVVFIEKSTDNINYLDASFINNCMELEIMFNHMLNKDSESENLDEEDEDDIEFF